MAPAFTSIVKWMVVVIIMLVSAPSFAQDKKPINNKGKIKQMKAKSQTKKEKASTKDISGKRLRTKNANSVANRAIYSNPSPYANKKSGKDRVASPVGGQPLRIRSRSAESARNNVYPQRGPFVNQGSKRSETSKSSRFSQPRPRSRTTSAESSRSNVYPQKGPFVNRASRQTERPAAGNKTRTGRMSTNARITKTYTRRPGSASQSAETSKSRRFGQSGRYVNQASRKTETASSGRNQYARRGKLSAGPRSIPPGKKGSAIPRSASQPFVTKGRKDVYWGKFSKGEKAITTDISGNPLRRRNYRTPPNEIIQPKDPYAGRKRSSGDRAYSGSFISGHVSSGRRTENAWKGDLSGQPLRKRADRQNQVAGEKIWSPNKAGGFSAKAQSMFDRRRGIKPEKGGGGSVSGKIQSNKPLSARAPGIGASSIMRSQNRMTGVRPLKGGGGSASGKYQSNKPLTAKAPGIGAAAMLRGQNRITGVKPLKGGGGSISGKMQSNKPLSTRAPGIGASTIMRSENRMTGIKPKKGGGGSMSGKIWNNNNQPINVRTPGIGAGAMARYENRINSNRPVKTFDQGGLNFYKGSGAERARSGKLMATEKSWNNNNEALPSPNYGKTAKRVAKFQGNARVREPEKGGGSVSGKLWNNNGKPIEVRTPKTAEAAAVDYSGNTKLPFFKRAYVRNPNASELALKKGRPDATVYKADGLQVSVKARETGTKPKAVKGSMPGLVPAKATVKASEYTGTMKMYWTYKHNPSSADESLNTIAPGRAHARISDYQGNVKMKKYNDKRFLPDARFAHGPENNVKQERTMKTDFKLLWTKIFKKNGTQPNAVKEKSVRPRYDKRERELWPGLYD